MPNLTNANLAEQLTFSSNIKRSMPTSEHLPLRHTHVQVVERSIATSLESIPPYQDQEEATRNERTREDLFLKALVQT